LQFRSRNDKTAGAEMAVMTRVVKFGKAPPQQELEKKNEL